MTMTTKGSLPWTLWSDKFPKVGTLVRYCPECDSKEIENDTCKKCGYHPDDAYRDSCISFVNDEPFQPTGFRLKHKDVEVDK